MIRPLLRMLLAVALAAVAAAVAGAIDGAPGFRGSFEILAPLGAVTTLLAELIAGQRRWLRSIHRRLIALALLAAAQMAAAVALFAALMFVSGKDVLFSALAAGYAGLIGLGAARLVARSSLADLAAVRSALADVGAGARQVEIAVRGDDELARLAADVEAMVAKVAAEERARRELVASVSHDLRTPITTIRLIAEGLEDGIFEPDRTREQVRLIATHVRALAALIDDLFELSRLEAGDVRWSMEQVPLEDVVREAIDAMRPQAEAGNVAISAELAPGSTARANPAQLQRVLFNLIQNAIRHTPPDGSVVVRAERIPGPAVEIEVADTGVGIDPALRPRIFEPFVQGPQRLAGENGSAGLGLAIARAVVAAHGGRIWLADGGSEGGRGLADGGSEAGRGLADSTSDAGPAAGTRIRFTLPAA